VFFGGMLLSQVVTFAAGVFVARWLGPESYGVLSLARNVYAVAIILAPLGLDLSLLRHLGENRGDWPRSIAQVQAFRRLAAVVNVTAALLLSFVAAPYIEAHFYRHPHFALYLGLTFLALPFTADLAIVGATMRGLERPIFQNLTGLYLQPLLRIGALALFLFMGMGVTGVILSMAVGVAAACGVMSWALWRLARKRGLLGHALDQHDRAAMGRVFGYSGWLAVMLFIYNTLRNVDILVLGRFCPVKEVGEYAALSTIAYTIQIFPQAVSQTLGAVVARRYAEGDLAGVRRELSQYLRRAVLLSSPIFAGVAVFGPWLDLLFGARYHFSPGLSFGLALAYMISGALGQMGVSLTMTGRHKLEFAVLILGGAFTLAACVLTAPRFGPLGVALSVSAGYALLNGVRTVLSARFMGGLDVSFGHLAAPLACLALAFGWKWILERVAPHTLVVGIAAAPPLLAAFAAVYWLALLRPAEKALIRGWLGRFSRRKPAVA
jgi:O-antigen/teichoic acid export membrane protein